MNDSLPVPFYDVDGITLYCADARELLPRLVRAGVAFDAIITDPVWPNATAELAGADDPAGLFTAAAQWFPALAPRLVVQLGCDSDPRFLAGVPTELPFLRACWLEYTLPGRKGRILNGSDVAYVFGAAPPSAPGQHLLSGRCLGKGGAGKAGRHPTPRLLEHVQWLVRWFARGVVLEPFAGSGTTLLAAKQAGLPALGIEISEEFCALAANRLRQMMLPLEIAV